MALHVLWPAGPEVIHRADRDRRILRTLLFQVDHTGVCGMRYGVVMEELAVEVLAQLPDDGARREVMALVEVARMEPRAWPDVRDPGSVEEIREAFGRRCWIQYTPHPDGPIDVREIGWAG